MDCDTSTEQQIGCGNLQVCRCRCIKHLANSQLSYGQGGLGYSICIEWTRKKDGQTTT